MKRITNALAHVLVAAAIIAVCTVGWGPAGPVVHAAPQDQSVGGRGVGIQLDVEVVETTVGEPGEEQASGSRNWRITAMTTSGQRVTVDTSPFHLFAQPFRLEDGRIVVEFDIRVQGWDRPGIVIQASASEVVLSDDEPTVVTAFADETRSVAVTLTATAVD